MIRPQWLKQQQQQQQSANRVKTVTNFLVTFSPESLLMCKSKVKRLLNKVAGLEWPERSTRHPLGSELDTDSTARFSPSDPRTNRRERRRSAGFGLGLSEGREGCFGTYEDMSRECVRIPCPEQSLYPRISCNIALRGKASDGSAGPLIRARSICDSRHRRATVKRSTNLWNNPRWNRTVQQRKSWNEIAKAPNSQLQLLRVFFFFSRRAASLTLLFSSLWSPGRSIRRWRNLWDHKVTFGRLSLCL